MNISFLLGAGVSIPAGMPSTDEITKKVLGDDGIMSHTDKKFYFGEPLFKHLNWPDEKVPQLINFVSLLAKEIHDYRISKRINSPINYEELYYVIKQIDDEYIREVDNPIIKPFIDKITPIIRSIDKEAKDIIGQRNWSPRNASRIAEKYIKCIVWHMLSKKVENYNHLQCVIDSIRETPIQSIFTLNHDILLENALSAHNILYNDGFSKSDSKVTFWEPSLFSESTTRVIKLHGSINWFYVIMYEAGLKNNYLIKYSGEDILHLESLGDVVFEPTPEILIGTFNKFKEYMDYYKIDLIYHLSNTMRSLDTLIISGYSFGDKGINNIILPWLQERPVNKFIIIHPDINELKENARPALSLRWNELVDNRKIIPIEEGFHETTWEEVKKFL